MKKLAIILALVALCFSCQTKEAKNDAIFSGTIENIEFSKTITVESIDGLKYEIEINEDGTFLDTLQLNGGMYTITAPNSYTYAYINKGGRLILDEKGAAMEAFVTYSGDHSEFNNYLFNKNKTDKAFSQENFELDEEAFIAKIENQKSNFENNLKAIKGLDKALLDQEIKAVNYWALSKMQLFKIHKEIYPITPKKVSDQFNKTLDNIDVNDEESYKFSNDYRNIIGNYIFLKQDEITSKDSMNYSGVYKRIIADLNNQFIKDDKLFIMTLASLPAATDIEKAYNDFIASSTNEAHKKQVTTLFESLKHLIRGNPSPSFENYLNYAGGTTSLEDLKGKYVYIDVWATWCGPCKLEIPFLKEVEKQYHGKNIHFVSLSVDIKAHQEKWEAMIKEKDLTGIQLLADNDFRSKFVQDYKIEGIPRFILLDPQGNIVSASAPRPSEKRLIELFDKLGI